MNHSNHTQSLDRLLLASVCAIGITMSACSELTAKPEKQSEAQACEDLKGLIADHPNQFRITKKIFQRIVTTTFGLRKKCFPMPITARYGNGVRDYITMFANGKQAAIKPGHEQLRGGCKHYSKLSG